MFADLSPADQAKYVAAKRAVELVEDGMKLGLGDATMIKASNTYVTELFEDYAEK